ncbi:uncharacterized protein LOC128741465 [Sabethes cyaneus]|uniref:uncharacterized protein LOC128741465 n=1 Tax=Sabethes cyaneus TaxID=53552 RepID=UPI00237E2457|nr:uncharacterized protein LOC128741465 [Sabethes cyaneus]
MTDLSTNICFDALSVLNGSVQLVENVCSICGASHYTQNCPEFAKGDHIKDKPSLNLSRSSVPNGLLIMDGAGPDGTSCVVTSQKFAKGTRFGPLLAQKSYVPIKNIPFPLVLFAAPFYYGNEFDFELQTLFNGRDVYLDTRNENKCNWMIHVSLARFSNEQNLICYQENDEIYYTAIKDIELGDILRVWYSRNYAAKIGTTLLEPSPYDICNNILRSVSLDYGLNLDQNQNYVDSFTSTAGAHHHHLHHQQPHLSSSSTAATAALMVGGSDMNNNSHLVGAVPSGEVASSYDKISLPPIDSLMKTSSPKYINHYHMFDLDLIAQQSAPAQSQVCDDYAQFSAPSQMHHSSQHHQHQSPSQAQMQHHQAADLHQQQIVNSSYSAAAYQTLPEDTLSPADLINISLGASDMNISFDSFSTGNLMGYDGGSSSGSNLGDSGISVSGGGQAMDKLHSRYSSSTDSLVTLNDALGMVPATPAPSTSSALVTAATVTADPEADKKYPCEICLRKYMTKSNLDKHMRKHNMFLCVFCMKLFQLAEELKDHECTERKSKTAYLHCPKCLKVLSNSWSLQRHMKIHKDPNESVLGVTEESADKLLVEPKEPPIIFDDIETTALDELKPSIESLQVSNEPLMLAVDETSDIIIESEQPLRSQEMDIEQEIESMQSQSQPQQQHLPPMVIQSITNLPTPAIPITNTCSSQEMITDVQAANGKQLYKCIVCAKLFKNPNALEKHLRKVHTVYTVSNDYKSEKKVITQISQKKTSPIKPAIAKALATKLTQKNKKIEANAAAGVSAEPNPSVPVVVPEQPIHVPRQYNKKKHLNKTITSTLAPPGSSMQVAQATAPTTIVSGSPPSTASNKSHSIIIISNLELTNNNLIDTSQLFLNQNSNALGNKIDLKVLNSTDKLPKLVPISNHGSHAHLSHQQSQSGTGLLPTTIVPAPTQAIPTSQFQNVAISSLQSAPSSINGSPNGGGTLLDRIASSSQHNLSTIIETSGIVDESSSQLIAESPVNGEPHLLTLSPIKITGHGSQEQGDRVTEATNTSFVSPDELSADANDSNQCDGDSDSAQLTPTSYPCDECDKVFPKNYQLKRHMEIHDSTYYMCPYCDRSPLKAKTSVRKHLNTVHPERAPAKEEMNKFIATLVVKDEKILQELYAKHERKIRNKCAKLQAKQLQQQQQQAVAVRVIQQEASIELTGATVTPEEMLNSYQSDSCGDEHDATVEGSERRCINNGGSEIRNEEPSSTLKRKPIADEVVGVSITERRNHSTGGDVGKKMRLVDANGHEVRYLSSSVASNNGALKYMRKKLIGLGEGSSSSSSNSSGHPMHPPPGGSGTHGAASTADNQMILDNLFDNISIENYEFDDNTSIQSYNLIEERFKTSFDQIQEKLDAELSFDEEQLKWQNNLMANDSSNEIGDKLLNVEENIMLI